MRNTKSTDTEKEYKAYPGTKFYAIEKTTRTT